MSAGEPRFLTEADWDGFFQNFEKSAFRLETLPVYRVVEEEEELSRFLNGEPAPPECAENEWVDLIHASRAAGKVMQRVHVVTPPLTDYLRYEFDWGYAFNAPAGEDIRILDLAATADPGLPSEDFWLFDDRIVVRMHYGDDGTFIGAEVNEKVDVDRYVRFRQLAVDNSVPFSEYRSGS